MTLGKFRRWRFVLFTYRRWMGKKNSAGQAERYIAIPRRGKLRNAISHRHARMRTHMTAASVQYYTERSRT